MNFKVGGLNFVKKDAVRTGELYSVFIAATLSEAEVVLAHYRLHLAKGMRVTGFRCSKELIGFFKASLELAKRSQRKHVMREVLCRRSDSISILEVVENRRSANSNHFCNA
eukprot:6357155-Amphidinium_carterae.1